LGPLGKELGVPVLKEINKMLAVWVHGANFRMIRIQREKARVGFPHRVHGQTLEEAEKRLELVEPDVSHSSGIESPEKLNLVAVQNRNKALKTAAKNGLVKMGIPEALSFIQTAKPSRDKGSERFQFEAGKTQDWQEGRGGRTCSKAKEEVACVK
jgi:hypothetical protein